MLYVMLLSMLMILISKCEQASYLWEELELTFEIEFDQQNTVDWGRMWLVGFNAGKAQLISFDVSNNFGANDVRMDESVLDEKLSFKILGLSFFSRLDWGSHIVSKLLKLPPRKSEPWFVL